nr:MAG TPA: cysteine peptidase [Caudoviricetes sp.]
MSTQPIYLALYRGRRDGSGWRVWCARATDWLTRVLTRGQYSHCEIAMRLPETADGQEYECYSASIRDGGVRLKTMSLPADKWDLIPLPDSVGERLHGLWEETQSQGYDLPGAFGVVFGLPENRRRWFCSEWVGAALGLSESWRFSPNDLAAIFKGDCHV